ncbi:MAG: hypothetical protein ACNI26_16965 [Terasakiella sp.]|uniref:hypothetical protein n=1 Tax=unclassified Terasakiella TaxID=2614952 RepID=UPI003B0053F4
MYHSQEYMEIGGKLITCPYNEDDYMYGINLHGLLCRLHDSGATNANDFLSIIISSIECENRLSDNQKIYDIYNQVMNDLANLGVTPEQSAH